MPVEPPLEGLSVFPQAFEDFIQGLPLLIDIPQEGRIVKCPGLEALLCEGVGGTERRSRMGDDRVNPDLLRDGLYLLWVEYRHLVLPPHGRLHVSILSHPFVLLSPAHSVTTRGSSDAKDAVSPGSEDAVVRDTPPAKVGNAFLGEICRIIMVAADENDIIVCFPQSAGDDIVDLVVISRLLESKSTVPGNDEQGVRAIVLDAQLMDNPLEIAVYVAGDDDLLDVWIVEYFHLISVYAARFIDKIRTVTLSRNRPSEFPVGWL